MASFYIHALGCKVNQYEEERMRGELLAAGLREGPPEEADLLIVNTCSVTAEADRKSRQMIRKALRAKGSAVVVAAGCAVENPGALAGIPEGVIRLRNNEKEAIAEKVLPLLRDWPSADSRGGARGSPLQKRTRALLKVQDGCRHFCSYCIVPYLRGPELSRPVSSAVKEARQLAEAGYSEIVLTGVHLGAWGKDLPGSPGLVSLLQELLEKVPGPRFRLSSLEPLDFKPELGDLMAKEARLCPHLHLPLQHGSPRILEKMRREYDDIKYLKILEAFLSKVPMAAVTTDLLVGFPSETEGDFLHLYHLVEKAPFSRLHVFQYSPRPGTEASRMKDDVPPEVKHRRSRELIRLGEVKSRCYKNQFVGRKLQVLIEDRTGRELTGVSENYLPVRLPGPSEWCGSIRGVLIEENIGEALRGKPIES